MVKKLYTTKIEAASEQAYDEISSFLSEISFGQEHDNSNMYYFTAKKREGKIKLNPKKNTIELTDKIEGWIIDSINHINHLERVR